MIDGYCKLLPNALTGIANDRLALILVTINVDVGATDATPFMLDALDEDEGEEE